MAHRVEGLGKVHCHHCGSPRDTPLVEPRDNLLGQRQKRNSGKTLRSEALLSFCKVDMRSDKMDRQ